MKANIQTAKTHLLRLLERFTAPGAGDQGPATEVHDLPPLSLSGEWVADDFVRSSSCW